MPRLFLFMQKTHSLNEVTPSSLLSLSCQLVCEWAGLVLKEPITDINNLARYLYEAGLSCGKAASDLSLMAAFPSKFMLSYLIELVQVM